MCFLLVLKSAEDLGLRFLRARVRAIWLSSQNELVSNAHHFSISPFSMRDTPLFPLLLLATILLADFCWLYWYEFGFPSLLVGQAVMIVEEAHH